jgi:uncharacterized protein (DUF342 family)
VKQTYWLTLDPATRELRAGFRADADVAPPDAEMLEAAVAARGWTADALDIQAVAAFVSRCREVAARIAGVSAVQAAGATTPSGTGASLHAELQAIEVAAAQLGAVVALADEPEDAALIPEASGDPDVIEGVVGAVIDGSFELEITADFMQVLMTLYPSRGGRSVALADLRATLAEQKVVFGVKEDDLLQMLEIGVGDDMLIAAGIPPGAGIPTRFENLLDTARASHPDADENALVDYRTLGSLVLVKPGMRLMRRIPSVTGKDGINVLGQPAAAQPPEDIPYNSALTGVVRDEADPEVLVAAIAGAPSVQSTGISVNPVVEVDAVNLSSGNIDFDGTLQVKGDITTGMTVKVSGDVVVSGTVEAAQIDAGGNVVVKGGIMGVAEGGPAGTESITRAAHVTAKGSVQARFIGNATISAGKDVVVEREIRQSDVAAGDSVTVGVKGSNQGSINGGQVRALRSVKAVTLGTMAGVKTLVQVGINPHAQMQKMALENTRKRLTEEKSKLEQLLIFLKKHPEKAGNGIGERALQTHAKLVADLTAVGVKEEKLAAETVCTEGASIVASKKIHGNVDLQIGNRREEIVEDMGSGKATMSDGKIIIR